MVIPSKLKLRKWLSGGSKAKEAFSTSVITNSNPFSVTTTYDYISINFLDPNLPYGPSPDLDCADIGITEQLRNQPMSLPLKSNLKTGETSGPYFEVTAQVL